MIRAEKLAYQWKKTAKAGVRNVDFTLEDGYILAVIGENGAGKSTLLKLLYGLMKPEQGTVTWNGKNVLEEPENVRQEVAYIGDELSMFSNATTEENLAILRNLYPDFSEESWEQYLELFEISKEMLTQRIDELSRGQKKKIQLAFALARHPKLLLLDEPTASLDPVFRVDFMDLLQKLVAKEEISVVISTHISSDVEEIADYIMVLREGEMVLYQDREEIANQYEIVDFKGLMKGEA